MGVRELEIWDMVGSYPTCPECKGKRVVRDAWAKWNGEARIMSRNRAAATIGPIVCDEDGPIPTLNISKTDRNIRAQSLLVGWGAGAR